MNRALGIIFGAVGEKQLGFLTAGRTLASVPFGGRYRLIDFTLSNMSNSGIYNVGVIALNNYQSLLRHVGSGKSWDLSRKNGGLRIFPPRGDSQGNTRWDALKSSMHFLTNNDERYVVLADGDCVCNIDFSAALDFHEESMADITVIYRKKALTGGNEKNKLCFTLDSSGEVVEAIKSEKAIGTQNVGTYMYIMGREFLLSLLNGEEDIRSLERDVICRRTKEFRIFGYEYDGYFASIDSVQNYYHHSMELLDRSKCAQLFDNNGANIYTKVRDSAPCHFATGCAVSNSIIADGCVVKGVVENSILFRGVRIEEGAVVKNSILFQDTYVGEGTLLNCVITDKNAQILENRMLSGHPTNPYVIGKNIII
ncbi:MAG: glucose-1-phosphate adenylyltransferase subunit GlgD [Clostridia bacterium]|nr:glucose-1-phosphate adenylyltransferase subunit GlgD [Clostridia bacterium]